MEKNFFERHHIIRFVALALAALIPILIIMTLAVSLPACYDEIFDAELEVKYGRLRSIDEPKIVVVGGSSVAFGLDSALLERYTGRPVVNFGLYAALGTKLMLDMSRKNINKGDIVILAPEMSEQTLSLYFNATETWRALDSRPSMIFAVGNDNYSDLAGSVFDYIGEKWSYLSAGTKPEISGVYTKASFNEYGDIIYPRPGNTMRRGADSKNPIILDGSILSDEFADYINDYIKYCEKRGATVYFSYPPMNEGGIYDADAATAEAFDAALREKIDCEFISDIKDYIMGSEFFFDSNFHLNDSGVPKRTARLALDLERAGLTLTEKP